MIDVQLMTPGRWYNVNGYITSVWVESFTAGTTDTLLQVSSLHKLPEGDDSDSISDTITEVGIEHIDTPVASVRVVLGQGASGVFRLVTLREDL